MPKGPKGQKRPADVIGNAVRVMQIATGEVEERGAGDRQGQGRCRAWPQGRQGAAEKMTPERRAEIAGKAAAKRWEVGAVRPCPSLRASSVFRLL